MLDRVDPKRVESLVHPKLVDTCHLGLHVPGLGAEIVKADETPEFELRRVIEILNKPVGVKQIGDRSARCGVERRRVLLCVIAIKQVVLRGQSKIGITAVVAVQQLRTVVNDDVINHQQTFGVCGVDQMFELG